jgi:hypothetical protein
MGGGLDVVDDPLVDPLDPLEDGGVEQQGMAAEARGPGGGE